MYLLFIYFIFLFSRILYILYFTIIVIISYYCVCSKLFLIVIINIFYIYLIHFSICINLCTSFIAFLYILS